MVRVLWLLILRFNPLGLVRLLELRRRRASRPVGLSSSLSRRPIAMVIVVMNWLWCGAMTLSGDLTLETGLARLCRPNDARKHDQKWKMREEKGDIQSGGKTHVLLSVFAVCRCPALFEAPSPCFFLSSLIVGAPLGTRHRDARRAQVKKLVGIEGRGGGRWR